MHVRSVQPALPSRRKGFDFHLPIRLFICGFAFVFVCGDGMRCVSAPAINHFDGGEDEKKKTCN